MILRHLRAQYLEVQMNSLQLAANELDLRFDGKVTQMDWIAGPLSLSAPDFSLDWGDSYLNHDAVNLNLPLQYSLKSNSFHFDVSKIEINDYLVKTNGDVDWTENGDFYLDVNLNTNDLIVEDIQSRLPQHVQKSLDGLGLAGKLRITEGKVKGTYNDERWPLMTAKVLSDHSTVDISGLPFPFTEVYFEAFLSLDLNGQSNLIVNSLDTKFNHSRLKAHGTIDDLLGDIGFNVNLEGDIPMSDVNHFLPRHLCLSGRTTLAMKADFTLNELEKTVKDCNLNRLKTNAKMRVKDFAFDMDTLHVDAPSMDVHLVLPASSKRKERSGAYVELASEQMTALIGKQIHTSLSHPEIILSADNLLNGVGNMQLSAELGCNRWELEYDTITAQIDTPTFTLATMPSHSSESLNAQLGLNGKEIVAFWGKQYAFNTNRLQINSMVKENKAKSGFLDQWDPTIELVLNEAKVQMKDIDDVIGIHALDLTFNAQDLDLKESTFSIGQSDLSLEGNVTGIKNWMEDRSNLMKGELFLTSNFLNINEILDLTSGLGRSHAEEEPSAKTSEKEDSPFMVPEGVDFNFAVKTKQSLYDNFDLNNLSGSLRIKGGTLILQEIGFTNKAAEMQLTAMYQSPRKNHLFLAMDFHLLNVQINDLLDMIPYVDTLVPMLKTFDGQAEFHIGAETYLKSNYEPKISTLRAAADIEGKNLSVKDQFTFTKITDMLNISTNGEYRVDSLDVQLTAYKNEIDLWPSQVAIGKYKVTVDGRMTLDQSGEYHLSVTQTPLPIRRMGLMISGPLNKLDYKLEQCKYPNLYKPNKRSDLEQLYLDLKKRIADQLKENVR